MNFDRPRWGEWLAGVSGLWLILLVFRAWYDVPDIDAAVTPFDAFDFEHIVFLLAGALGVLLLLMVAAEREDEVNIPFGAVVAVVGLIATALAAYRIASPPADDLEAALGSYLGLLASLGVAAGGLIAARDAAAGPAPAAAETPAAAGAGDDYAAGTAGGQDWSAAAAPATTGWSPAPPAPTTTGWSPAPPQEDVSRPVQPGDTVELTEGSPRFARGTTGTVIETFGGGALVELRDEAGTADRVELPSDAFVRAGTAGAGAAAAGSWSPGMPSAAGEQQGQDWGFDEPAGTSVDEPPAGAEPAAGPEAGDVEADGDGAERPGFFARLFRRKPKEDQEAGDELPTIEGPGVESADVPADHPGDWETPAATASEPDYPSRIPDTPEPSDAAIAAAAPEAEAAAVDTPAPEPADLTAEPEAAPAEPEPAEPAAAPEEPDLPGDAAPESGEAPAPEAEPEAPEPAPAEPAPAADVAPAEPEPAEPEPAPEPAAAADKDTPAEAGEPKKKAAKKRRKSSATMKTPPEAAAGPGRTPEIGDEVELQVSGGKWDAGTRGTVVDAFAAGVIVEVYGEDGKAERLDLPFEAVSIVES